MRKNGNLSQRVVEKRTRRAKRERKNLWPEQKLESWYPNRPLPSKANERE